MKAVVVDYGSGNLRSAAKALEHAAPDLEMLDEVPDADQRAIGCGAGNNTLKLLQSTPPFDCDLVDLSRPMLRGGP